MNKERYKLLAERLSAKRKRKQEKLIADIEAGIVPGIVKSFTNSYGNETKIVKLYGKKGYIPFNTRTLIKKVTERFDRREAAGLDRTCYINSNRGGLQIRKKHLRRLLKKMPNVKYRDNKLYEEIGDSK